MDGKENQSPQPYKRKEGWQQFLTNKLSMLHKYREAKLKMGGRPVKVEHGNSAEAELRTWLETFLPKRFGVTSGYLITQKLLEDDAIRHFDVIIYDQLNCPILWVDENPDKTDGGKSKAIPVEYVYGVIEVKSNFTLKSVTEGLSKLDELKPFLESIDTPDERYKQYLPKDFFSCLVFFEIQKKEEFNHKALDNLVYLKRGFYGTIILSAEGKNDNQTAIINLLNAKDPAAFSEDFKKQSLIEGWPVSTGTKFGDLYLYTMIQWTDVNFSMFAFDLLAMINGTYEPGRASSFHGLGIGINLPKKDN